MTESPLVVGRVPFLVCAPFFHSTLPGGEAAPGSRFIDGVPSFLNRELHAGRVDCAPSSSFEYGLHHRNYRLFPGISTSSRLEMKSVLFLSQAPWEELGDAPV
jgi:chorismate dehydratase